MCNLTKDDLFIKTDFIVSEKKQKMEAPYFMKKIGDTEVYKGMTAKFTACASGCPEPEVKFYSNHYFINNNGVK